MRASVQRAVAGLGLVFALAGCRDRQRQPQPRVAPPTVPDPAARLRQPIPFSPTPGEVAPAEPCGRARRAPCLMLGWEFYNWAWGYTHSAWFMDSDGREYEFQFDFRSRHLGRPEDADPVRAVLLDGAVSEDDFARIVEVSTLLPRRVTTAEATHARLLLAASRASAVETVSSGACYDGGGSAITGFVYDAGAERSKPLLLEESQCYQISKANGSRAARELSQWVYRLRDTRARAGR